MRLWREDDALPGSPPDRSSEAQPDKKPPAEDAKKEENDG
jgi:hypothetical protein